MISNPARKYRRFTPINLSERTWPDQVIGKAPVWMSTDLRDGNQALIEPMSIERKLRMFKQLLAVGFKEIEVAFPSASQTDFDFVRLLIEDNIIPGDVTIEVLTQAREELIVRTIESLRGIRRAILHLYNPISSAFSRLVFDTDLAGVKEIALYGTRLVKQMTDRIPETEWIFQYSPEMFASAELPFAKEVCDAVVEIWQPTPQRKMIINLPATVEVATPNVYADQIEWMHRHLAYRDRIVLSVHPHNDRGCAVAAAELALMAGAERVEGCLFGGGERTGNVDLVTIALNLYSQGIDPGLDFSDIDRVRQTVEDCTRIPVHPRHPYVGDLVFTAFSGSHQDAIKKGFAHRDPDEIWEMPYLPIDPVDLNRNYDAVIRVNSQSGKGGVSFILEHEYGFCLPRRMQIEFSRVIKHFTDTTAKEARSTDIYNLFCAEYLEKKMPYNYLSHQLQEQTAQNGAARYQIHVAVSLNGRPVTLTGCGNGPIAALADALPGVGIDFDVVDYHEHAIGSGADAVAVCYLEARVNRSRALFGVGIDGHIVSAALKAVFSVINRSKAMIAEPCQV